LLLTRLTHRLQTHRRWLILLVSLLFTAVTLYLVFRGIDYKVFWRLLDSQERSLLAAASLLIVLQIAFGGERWGAILSAISGERKLPRLRVQTVFYASIFFNSLPVGTVGGDVARVWLARAFAIPIGQIVLSVLLDRVLVVGALLALAVVTLPEIANPLLTSVWIGCAASLFAAATGFLLLRPIEHLLERWRNIRFMPALLGILHELDTTIRRAGLPGFFFALLSAASGDIAVYCIAQSLGIAVGPVAMIAVMSIVSFLAALPISFAGWGMREISLVSLLGLLEVDREAALVLSVQFGILSTLVSLLGGIAWLTLRNPRDVEPSAD
jgi:glycosyltransferase 2 family protein